MKKIFLSILMLQSILLFGQTPVTIQSFTPYSGTAADMDSTRLLGILKAGNAWSTRTFYFSDYRKYLVRYTDTLQSITTRYKQRQDSLFFALGLAGKQGSLISGTNIKTINGISLLGSGNISVSGVGGGTTGAYITQDGKLVTVTNGSITAISALSVNIVTLGTSLTYGAQATVNPVAVNPATQSWPAVMAASLGANYTVTNLGSSGAQNSFILSNQVPAAVALYDPSKINIAIIEGATNDIATGVSADSTYQRKKRIHAQLQAAGFQTIDITMPAFNNSATALNSDPIAVEQKRQDLLDLERAGWQGDMHAKGLIDWTSNNTYGLYVGPGNQDNTYYQPDGVHFTPAGYAQLAAMAVPAVLAVTTNSTYGTVATAASTGLAALTTTAGTLTPTFSSGTLKYTASVSNSTGSVTFTPTVSAGTVTVHQTTVASGSPSAGQSLAVGSNLILIQTKNSLTRKTYQVDVTRAGASVNYLDFSVSNINITSPSTGSWTTSTSPADAVAVGTMAGDGYIQYHYAAGVNDAIAYGLDDISTLDDFVDGGGNGNWNYCFYIIGGSVRVHPKGSGAASVITSAPYGYYRIDRASGVVTLQYSATGTGSWSGIYTWSGTSTGNLYPKVTIAATGNVLLEATHVGVL